MFPFSFQGQRSTPITRVVKRVPNLLVNFQPWSMYGEEDGSYDLKWAVKFQT